YGCQSRCTRGIQLLAGKPGAIAHIIFVIPGHKSVAVVLVHRMMTDTHVVRGMFGLAIPPKWAIEPRQQVRTPAPQLVVCRAQADEPTQSALLCRLETEKTNGGRGHP